MSDRKVYADVEMTVLVPVKVKAGLIVRADEGVPIEQTVSRQLRGRLTEKDRKRGKGLDIEVEDTEVLDVCGMTQEDDWEYGIAEEVDMLTAQVQTVHSFEITDSK